MHPNGCWLHKQSHKHRLILCQWLLYYFVIEDGQLLYYRNKSDTSPRGILDLKQYRIDIYYGKDRTEQDVFRCTSDHPNLRRKLIVLRVDNADDCTAWLRDSPRQHLPSLLQHSTETVDSADVLSKYLEKFDLVTESTSSFASRVSSPTSSISTMSEATSLPPNDNNKADVVHSLWNSLRSMSKSTPPNNVRSDDAASYCGPSGSSCVQEHSDVHSL